MTAAQLAALVDGRRPGLGATRLVCIDGPAGAGKTTLAAELAAALGGRAAVVHLEDLYPGWDGLDASWDYLERWVLRPLRHGEPGRMRRWDWLAGTFGEQWYAVPVVPVLIVEGVGAGRRAADADGALVVWLEAPAELRWQRLMARDGAAMAPELRRWIEGEAAHFARERTRERAAASVATGSKPGPA